MTGKSLMFFTSKTGLLMAPQVMCEGSGYIY